MRPKNATTFIVYLVTNEVNGKQYIGFTTQTLKRRWYLHCWQSKQARTPLHRAILKYGRNAFAVQHIASASNWVDLQHLERLLITQYRTKGRGYNVTTGGEGGDASSGRKRSAAHIEAIKKAHTGKVVSEETRQRLREIGMRAPVTQAMLDGLARGRASRRGKPNPATAERNRLRRGIHLSPEHKEKLRITTKRARAARFWSSRSKPSPAQLNLPL